MSNRNRGDGITSLGRDPRRAFTDVQRAQILARQHHECGYCGHELERFEVHHIVPWARGGPTETDNGVALCLPCHKAAVPADPVFELRDWQHQALTKILPILNHGEFATLNAAPGAGKTLFTGEAFRQLNERGVVDRMVVFVPYRHLCNQWADTLKLLGIYLNPSAIGERRREHGVVLTYQGIGNCIGQLQEDAAQARTLVVLDEVHHLGADARGQAGSWAVFVEQLVGPRAHPRLPVLNLTGTLFRSNQSERISTIRYQERVDGKIETTADYSITAAELVKQGILRGIRLLAFDQEFTVNAVALEEASTPDAVSMKTVDIDARFRSMILRPLLRNDQFIDGMIAQTCSELQGAALAMGGAPVKGLMIADTIEHARQIHGRFQSRPEAAACFVATGDDPAADRTIEAFRKHTGQAVLIAVQKVTEGFDVPDVCVLAYLNSWRAPLFIHQMIGRAMRVTDHERRIGYSIPATVIIPDEKLIKEAFATVLVSAMRMLEVPSDPCPRCGKRICACPMWTQKICRRCGQPYFVCVCPPRSGPTQDPCAECDRWPCICERVPDEQLITVTVTGELTNSYASWGAENAKLWQIRDLVRRNGVRGILTDEGMPAIFAEALLAAIERHETANPFTEGTPDA